MPEATAVYEKEGNKLKITVPSVELVSHEEIVAEKEAIESSMVGCQARFEENMDNYQARLDAINKKLETAEQLGVVPTPVVALPVDNEVVIDER